MNTSLTNIIKKWVPEKSKVIDFGCGDGSLLQDLIDKKNIRGYGAVSYTHLTLPTTERV